MGARTDEHRYQHCDDEYCERFACRVSTRRATRTATPTATAPGTPRDTTEGYAEGYVRRLRRTQGSDADDAPDPVRPLAVRVCGCCRCSCTRSARASLCRGKRVRDNKRRRKARSAGLCKGKGRRQRRRVAHRPPCPPNAVAGRKRMEGRAVRGTWQTTGSGGGGLVLARHRRGGPDRLRRRLGGRQRARDVLIIAGVVIVLAVAGVVALLVYRARQDRPGRPIRPGRCTSYPPKSRPQLEESHKPAIGPAREIHSTSTSRPTSSPRSCGTTQRRNDQTARHLSASITGRAGGRLRPVRTTRAQPDLLHLLQRPRLGGEDAGGPLTFLPALAAGDYAATAERRTTAATPRGPKRITDDVEYPAIGVLLNPSALGIPFGAVLGHLVQDDRSWHRALKPLGRVRVGRLEPGRATAVRCQFSRVSMPRRVRPT